MFRLFRILKPHSESDARVGRHELPPLPPCRHRGPGILPCNRDMCVHGILYELYLTYHNVLIQFGNFYHEFAQNEGEKQMDRGQKRQIPADQLLLIEWFRDSDADGDGTLTAEELDMEALPPYAMTRGKSGITP